MKVKPFRDTLWRQLQKDFADSYSKMIIDFAERLADLLEEKIGTAKYCHFQIIQQNYKSCVKRANTEHINSSQYTLALIVLEHFWFYGDDLMIVSSIFEEV